MLDTAASRSTVRRAALLSTAAILFAAGPAWAQDGTAGTAGTTAGSVPPNTAGDSQAPSVLEGNVESQSNTGGVEEIVVTAQRRRESLQDVPLSVTALSAETLKNANITDVTRLEQLTPGLRIGRSGSDARPAIRGVFTEAIGANSDPRIGFYVDDIYQSRTSQALAAFVDLERVEVQRGPQGTLYGRNSYGGNIALFSATPKDDFAAGIDALYGRFNRRRVEGFVNVPLTEGIAARVAGLYEKMDGYVKNTSTGSDLGDEDQYYLRGSLRIAPASLPDLEVMLRGSYFRQGGNGLSAFGYKSIGSLVDIPLIVPPGGSFTVGGRTFTFPNGFNGSSFSGTPVPFNTRFRDGIADINGADIGLPVEPDPYRINFDTDAIRRTRQQQYSGTINYDFGPVAFRSISSYTKFYANRSSDNDFSPAPLAEDFNETKVRTYTQELQLLSDDRGPFQWIVGGFYFDDKVTEIFYSAQNRNYPAVGQTTNVIFPFSFTFFPTTPITRFRSDTFAPVRASTKSYAGYAQASYEIADALTLTAGYRYTSDRKRYAATVQPAGPRSPNADPGFFAFDLDTSVNFACGGSTAADPSSNATNAATAQLTRCGRGTFNFSTYRLAVDYKINDDTMVYASLSTGRRSGGFNNTLTPAGDNLVAFEPEKVTAYEIGTKNNFLDNRLQFNLAAFYNNYTDLQVQTSIPAPSGLTVLSLVTNAGRNTAYGVELDAIARPTRQLTLQLAVNYLDAKEVDYQVNTFSFGFCGVVAGNCAGFPAATLGVQGTPFPNPVTDPGRFVPVLNASGQQVIVNGIPQFNYVVAGRGSDGRKYRSKVALSPDITIQAGAAYDFVIPGFGTITPNVQFYYNSGYILTDLSPAFGNQERYTKTDLRINYISENERFSAQVFVENLENKAVINRVAYGNNRSLNGSYAPPRTYGVRAGFRF